MSQAYEKRLTDLASELQGVKGQLEAEKKKAEMPPQGMKQLQNEMSSMKV